MYEFLGFKGLNNLWSLIQVELCPEYLEKKWQLRFCWKYQNVVLMSCVEHIRRWRIYIAKCFYEDSTIEWTYNCIFYLKTMEKFYVKVRMLKIMYKVSKSSEVACKKVNAKVKCWKKEQKEIRLFLQGKYLFIFEITYEKSIHIGMTAGTFKENVS